MLEARARRRRFARDADRAATISAAIPYVPATGREAGRRIPARLVLCGAEMVVRTALAGSS